MLHYRILAAVALFFVCTGLMAQGDDEVLETEIVVTGERRAKLLQDSVTATEVIRREDIVQSGARNAADALENHPGVEVREGLRGRFVRLQGLDPEYVLILVNGQRVTGRVDGAIDLTRFKAEEIERIEIVKGASSALYGADALGGVINIITRKSDAPIRAEFETSYGSGREKNFGSGHELSTSGVVGLSNDFLSSTFVAGWTRSDGYDLAPVDTRERQVREAYETFEFLDENDLPPSIQGSTGTAFRDLGVGNRSTFVLTENFLVNSFVNYRYLDQERTDFSPPRAVIDRRSETHDFMGVLNPVLYLANDGRLSFSYSQNRFFDRLDRDQRDSDELDTFETQDDRTQEGRVQFDYRVFEDHFISTGVDVGFDELISPRVEDEYVNRTRVGVFLQDEWEVIGDPNWVIVPGVRHDEDSQFGAQTTPKFATRLDPFENLRLRGSVGVGYRAPAFKDLYITFQNPGVGYEVVGNEDLDPERSISYNGGIEFEPIDWLYLSVNGFYNTITNLIDFQAVSGRTTSGLQRYQTVNISKAYTRGGELFADFRISRALRFGVGYTFTQTWDREQKIPLEGRAEHRGTYRLQYEYLPWGLGFSINGSVYGPQAYYYTEEAVFTFDRSTFTFDQDFEAPLRAIAQDRSFGLVELNPDFPQQGFDYRNPYHLLGVRVFKRVMENYELFAGVDNMLDEYDPEINPIRPRFFYFGLRATYEGSASADNRITPELERGRYLDTIE